MDTLDADTRAKLAAEWDGLHRGPQDQAMLPEGIGDFLPILPSKEDAEFLKTCVVPFDFASQLGIPARLLKKETHDPQ